MSIRPLYDRILIKRNDAPEKTKSGLYLPSSSSEKPSQGQVLATGAGHLKDNGELRPLEVNVGDTVIFGKYSGNEINVDGNDYLILSEDEVLGILEQ
ncbi:MAG: co-chaperone GroES [Myxococcota bacterium]|nr:co-chaperone GroES [Myxococcota bacterium]